MVSSNRSCLAIMGKMIMCILVTFTKRSDVQCTIVSARKRSDNARTTARALLLLTCVQPWYITIEHLVLK